MEFDGKPRRRLAGQRGSWPGQTRSARQHAPATVIVAACKAEHQADEQRKRTWHSAHVRLNSKDAGLFAPPLEARRMHLG